MLILWLIGCSGPQPPIDQPPTGAGPASSIDLNAAFSQRREPPDAASEATEPKVASEPAPAPPKPHVPRYHPFLTSEDPSGSASIGTTSDGYLVGGVPLPQPHAHLQVLPTQAARDLAFGSKALIDTLVFAADALAARHPGTVTFLGNIGRRNGGDIPYSVSHNSGRDVDIAFVATNPFEWQTRPQTLLHFQENLQSTEHFGFYRFDAPRNAALVEALFTSPHTRVQHLFVASHLKRHLLNHWKKAKLNANLLAQLDEVTSQPSDSAAHDDHLHLRVACSEQDLCHGCQHTGRTRTWMPDDLSIVAACTAKLNKTALHNKDPEQRARALERLILLDAKTLHATAATALQKDKSERVRAAATQALTHLAPAKTADQHLTKLVAKETSALVRCALPPLLARLNTSASAQALATLLTDDTPCPQPDLPEPPALLANPPTADTPTAIALAELAANACADIQHKAPVAALIERLSDPRPSMRAAAALALERITNRPDPTDWLAANPQTLAEAQKTWGTWYGESVKLSRDQWLVAGFQSYGFGVKDLKKQSIPGLIDAILGPASQSYNAQRTLMRLTDHWPRSLDWPPADAHAYWLRYARKNQKRLKIKLP